MIFVDHSVKHLSMRQAILICRTVIHKEKVKDFPLVVHNHICPVLLSGLKMNFKTLLDEMKLSEENCLAQYKLKFNTRALN